MRDASGRVVSNYARLRQRRQQEDGGRYAQPEVQVQNQQHSYRQQDFPVSQPAQSVETNYRTGAPMSPSAEGTNRHVRFRFDRASPERQNEINTKLAKRVR